MRLSIVILIAMLFLALLSACGTTPPPAAPPDITYLPDVDILPAQNSYGVGVDTVITVCFHARIDITTMPDAYELRNADAEVVVPCALTWNEGDSIATFTPDAPLAPQTAYRFWLGMSIRGYEGEQMASEVISRFQTIPDPPSVVATLPADGAVGVGLEENVYITFNSAWYDEESVEERISISPDTPHWFGYLEDEFRVYFSEDFQPGTEYTVTIAAGVVDDFGQTMDEPFSFGFTTEGVADHEPPEIVSYEPANGATDVAQDVGEVRVVFNEEIDPESFAFLTLDYRLLHCGLGEPIFEEGNTVVRFEISDLPAGVDLLAVIGPCDDVAGNTSYAFLPYTFTTAGEAVIMPHAEGDWWNYALSGDDPVAEDWVEKAEDVTGDTWHLNRYLEPIGGRSWNVEDYTLADYRRELGEEGNLILWQGWNESPPDGEEITFSSPVTYLDCPLDLGKAWNSSTTCSQEETDYSVQYAIYVQFIEDVVPDVMPSEIDLPATTQVVFPDCAKVVSTFEYRILGSATVVKRWIASTWYSPGVGVVRQRMWFTPYSGGQPGEEEYTVCDLLRWSVTP